MKKIFLLIISTIVLFAAWEHSSNYDEFEGKKYFYLIARSLNTVYDYIRPYKSSLIVRIVADSSGIHKEIYITTQEYVGNVDEIETKYDNGPIKIVRVFPSTDHKAMFIADTYIKTTLQNFKKHNKFYVRYQPFSENPRTVKFSLKGFSKKYHIAINSATKFYKKLQAQQKKERMRKLLAKYHNRSVKSFSECEKKGGEINIEFDRKNFPVCVINGDKYLILNYSLDEFKKIAQKIYKTAALTRDECKNKKGCRVGWNFDIDRPVCKCSNGAELRILE